MTKLTMSFLVISSILSAACVTGPIDPPKSDRLSNLDDEVMNIRVWVAPKYAEALEPKDPRSATYKNIEVRKKPILSDSGSSQGATK